MTWRIRWEELSGERKKSEKRPNEGWWNSTPWRTNSTTGNTPADSTGNSMALKRSDSETSLTRGVSVENLQVFKAKEIFLNKNNN